MTCQNEECFARATVARCATCLDNYLFMSTINGNKSMKWERDILHFYNRRHETLQFRWDRLPVFSNNLKFYSLLKFSESFN